MPSDNDGIDVSALRTPMDTQEGEDATDVSPMQEYAMEREETVLIPEQSGNYRIRTYEYGNPDKLMSLEYFTDFYDAEEVFDLTCEDEEFAKAYGKFFTVEMSKAYRTEGGVHWEPILIQMCYPKKE